MKRQFVFSIFLLLFFLFLAGCSSFVQDIKTISNKKEYTISFFAPGCKGQMDSIKVQYQQKITLPDCAFTPPDVTQDFAGWAIDADETQAIYPEDGEIEVTEDISLYAMWMDKDKTRYKVIHLFKNLDDDDYTENKELAQDLWGYDGALTEAKALKVEGFTADSSFEQIIIEQNAKPVQEIQIKYNRNKYTISFEADGDCTKDPIKALYQEKITVPRCDCENHNSMKFAGWSYVDGYTNEIAYLADEEIEVTDNIHLYAQWEPEGTSEYKVIHLFQNINDDGYTEDTHQIFEGTNGAPIVAEPLTVPGFEVFQFDPPLTDQLVIEEDNGEGPKTIIKIKYNRKLVTLTFDLKGGTITSPALTDGKLVLRYGAEVPVLGVEKEDHKFTGWTPALPTEAIENDSYTAGWEISYKYPYGTDGGLLGTSTIKQGAIAKDSIRGLPNTADLYVVPKGTIASIDTDGSLVWYPNGLENSVDIHVHGAFHYGRKIELSPYIMSQYPVTTELYKYVMGKDPSTDIKTPMKPYESNPVNNIKWYDAVIFCNELSMLEELEPVYYYINEHGRKVTDPKLWVVQDYPKIRGDHTKNGYRLPTNAEWEFAARGGNPAATDIWHYAFSGVNLVSGATLNTNYQADANLDKYAYYKGNTGQKGPCTVGQKLPNSLGLYDMSGGICEWTYDFINKDFSLDDTPYLVNGIVLDPMGTETGTLHSLRGGSYFSSAFYCTVTYILSENANSYKYSYGFRLCRNAE